MLLLWAGAAVQDDDVERLRGEGFCLGVGPVATAGAVDNAQQSMIVDFLEALVASGDLTPFAPMLESPGQYIHSFNVVDQSVDDGATRVTIDAYLLANRLRRDAATLMLRSGAIHSSVVLLLGQSSGLKEPLVLSPPSMAETILAERLAKARLAVTDPAKLRECYTDSELKAVVQGDKDAVGRFAYENLTDLAVVGAATCYVDETQGAPDLHPCTAVIVLRVGRASDERDVGEFRAKATVHGLAEEGLHQAIEDACDKLISELVTSCVVAAAGAPPLDGIRLTLERPGRLHRLDEIATRLALTPGVASVETLHFSPREAYLRLRYTGPPRPLVKSLEDGRYSDFRVEARQVVAQDMVMAVIESGEGETEPQVDPAGTDSPKEEAGA